MNEIIKAVEDVIKGIIQECSVEHTNISWVIY